MWDKDFLPGPLLGPLWTPAWDAQAREREFGGAQDKQAGLPLDLLVRVWKGRVCGKGHLPLSAVLMTFRPASHLGGAARMSETCVCVYTRAQISSDWPQSGGIGLVSQSCMHRVPYTVWDKRMSGGKVISWDDFPRLQRIPPTD